MGATAASPRKIVALAELARITEQARSAGRRIVHCHGVFDLLHVGHIRHLERARELGDLLVVTITPDELVNKGPHRPAFGQMLRAEALAALGCVDHVAINQWPSAVETLALLRPHFYAKGADYRDQVDHTGGIARERAAVEAAGGQLVFTDELSFSSSTLLNRHFSPFPVAVADYLRGFRSRHSVEDALSLLQNAADLRVLVIGETIIDEYQYCSAIGKSAKDPTLVVKKLSEERFAGGILAVCNHVANFVDRVGLVTFLGAEASQEDFVRAHLPDRVEKILLRQRDGNTIVKRRFVDQYFFAKLFEVYEFNDSLHEGDDELLCAALEEALPRYDVVVVFDFGHGMMTERAIDLVCSKARFLAVNTQSNAGNLGYNTISRYPRADYVCIAEHELRLEARNRSGDLKSLVATVARVMRCPRVVCTRGANGALCYAEGEGFVEVPALATKVVDRLGAGDAFLSLTALCAAQGAPQELLGFIGNAVGAQAVATVAHRTSVERAGLFKHIEALLK